MCRSRPLDTLIIFRTTISVSNVYSTNIVFIVPIISLYTTVVVVVISFSIIVSCMFISLLLVTVDIVCSKMCSNTNVVISILIEGENISIEASHVMYINSINIPPMIIINRMYENQNLLYIFPLMKHTIVVCIDSISPTGIGRFLVIVPIDIRNFVMSGYIYLKYWFCGLMKWCLVFPM